MRRAALPLLASLALLATLALGACASDTPEATPTAPAPSATAAPEVTATPGVPPDGRGAGNRGPTVIIDWVNAIQVDGGSYHRLYTVTTASEKDLGTQVAEVQFTVSQNVFELSYRFKDGDATFLEVGTPIFSFRDYDPGFRLAVRTNDEVVVYELDTRKTARVGGDLLDLEEKVVAIRLDRDFNGNNPARITDAELITDLVAMVLDAPVNLNNLDDGGLNRVFIWFELVDGSEVGRVFGADSRTLQRGITLPQAFADAVDAALADRR